MNSTKHSQIYLLNISTYNHANSVVSILKPMDQDIVYHQYIKSNAELHRIQQRLTTAVF